VPLHRQRTVSQFKTRRDAQRKRADRKALPKRIAAANIARQRPTAQQKADSENQLRAGMATTLPSSPAMRWEGLPARAVRARLGELLPTRHTARKRAEDTIAPIAGKRSSETAE
jgi:hypothetical protein